ncbi:MAG TPA: alpha-amylase family glycosyl hydrolase [Kofleriaceae bacterium]
MTRWLVVLLLAACQAPLPPDWHQQVIYLALTDRFADGDASNDNATGCFDRAAPRGVHGGDLAGLRAHLDYVQDLGATAVWITPPNRQAGPDGQCGYHGYWIDYTDPSDEALEPELGSAADLVALVADLHARGMRFVLDMVVNHAGDRARIVRQHPSWFHDPKTCGTSIDTPRSPSGALRGGNAGAEPDLAIINCPLGTHPDFAQEQPEVAAYLSAFEARMAARYSVDAIRMDTAKHVRPDYFAHSFFPALRAARPNVWSIAEIFDGSSARVFVPYLDAGFDSAFHYPLHGALVDGIAKGGPIGRIAEVVQATIEALGEARAQSLVLFVDNHDVPRFATQAGARPDAELRARLLAAYTLLFTLPGIPQLYYGDELGMLGGADPDNRRDLPAWASDPIARAAPHPGEAVAGSDIIYRRVQRLAQLRTTVRSLATGHYRELARDPIYAFERGDGVDRRIVIANGATAASATVPIDLPDGTTLRDDLDGPTITVANHAISLALPPHETAIYRIAP